MSYEDKIKMLEEAERRMLEAFSKYAIENNIDKDIQQHIIEKFRSAIKNKKAEYFIEDRVSNISESINEVITTTFSDLLKSSKETANSSNYENLISKKINHAI